MALSGFICHDDYLKKTERLSDEQLGRVFRALMTYHATGEETDLDALESVTFDFIRVDIDRSDSEYRKKCEKNRSIRLEAINNERQRTSTDVDERDLNKNKNKKKNMNKNNKEGDKEPLKRFTPPTVEEVAEYCRERNNGINAQHFVDYYTQGNWILKNGRKMADWKAAVRTWEGNGYHNKPAIKTVPAQNYTQRDYSGEQAEAMARMLKGAAG